MGESGSGMTLQRPYLLRAMHEWMTDNNLTPHIVIDIAAAETALPLEYAKDGKLVLNISYSATQNLVISNDHASFDARFGGVSRRLDVPVHAIVGIYARESGQGMIFASESAPADANAQLVQDASGDDTAAQEKKPEPNGERRRPSRPELKIIK